ncbi:hypothetical protein SPHINGO361_150128 [Sphingomonas sp. EC-HK361]|uniref:winged helix DNA-binding protein n=1 Tax=Sphingomonas sp. EC-HK361 TaxID=2038397 RepID=UPI00125760EE|nr:winged helix DNA-binding protein [Sphingomonas sp. EC-HK361]VVT20924.1 hypothetical protein SPHINGO361_150128 [Sphingomonas sp. EC-HK361]
MASLSSPLEIHDQLLLAKLGERLALIAENSLARPSFQREAEQPINFTIEHTAKALIDERKRRIRHFGEYAQFATGPSWSILLDLTANMSKPAAISINSACLASGAPATTGLRHLAALVNAGLIARDRDPFDGRRTFVRLTPLGERLMTAHLAR